MKKLLIVGLVGAAAVPANAQTIASGTGMNSPNYSTHQRSVESLNGVGSSETPSMRAQKLARAKSLKIEAEMLLKQDGGKLTPEHNAYIRGKVCEILGYGRTGTGSLAPRHRC